MTAATIDALLDEAARAGRLTGVTIYVTQDGRWQAALRHRDDATSWTIEIRDTPAEALAAVLGAPRDASGSVFD